MLKNTAQTYGKVAKYFHWIVAVLISCMLMIGSIMINLAPSAQKWQIYAMHKATGLLVLFLVFLRLTWRLFNIKVEISHNIPLWMRIAANLSHSLLYLMMFIMPISGISMSLFSGHELNFYGLFVIKSLGVNLNIAKLTAWTHFYSAILLAFLIIIHILAATYHHFVLKDDVLRKMTSK